jgi:hypothetical protein
MSEKDKEKKKIALKLSFSNLGDLPRRKEEPQMITEWNYTRIAIALVLLFILIVVGISILQNGDVPVVTGNNAQEKQIKEVQTNISHLPEKVTDSIVLKEKKQAVVSSLPDKKTTFTIPSAQISGSMKRAQLAKGIWKNEPFGKITGTIKVNSKEATGIFYFTELENMAGKAVFHIWKYKGDVIYKKKKDILEDHGKTYTSKLFTRRSIGPWSVETVDSNNRQLNVINFKVLAARN